MSLPFINFTLFYLSSSVLILCTLLLLYFFTRWRYSNQLKHKSRLFLEIPAENPKTIESFQKTQRKIVKLSRVFRKPSGKSKNYRVFLKNLAENRKTLACFQKFRRKIQKLSRVFEKTSGISKNRQTIGFRLLFY